MNNNNIYLFVHTFTVCVCEENTCQTHAHIHFYRLFIKSQCLLHQLTHSVNFSNMYEFEEVNGRLSIAYYKDHYHPLIIIAFVAVCCSCLLSLSLSLLLSLCSFASRNFNPSVWHSVRLSWSDLSVQYNVYAFSTSTNSNTIYWLLQRFNKFLLCCCCCCCFSSFTLFCFAHSHTQSVHIFENLFRYIFLPKNTVSFFFSHSTLLSTHGQYKFQTGLMRICIFIWQYVINQVHSIERYLLLRNCQHLPTPTSCSRL